MGFGGPTPEFSLYGTNKSESAPQLLNVDCKTFVFRSVQSTNSVDISQISRCPHRHVRRTDNLELFPRLLIGESFPRCKPGGVNALRNLSGDTYRIFDDSLLRHICVGRLGHFRLRISLCDFYMAKRMVFKSLKFYTAMPLFVRGDRSARL
jgi:hypothetical protein